MTSVCKALLATVVAALTLTAAAQQPTTPMTPMTPMTDHGVSVHGKPLASPAATATTTLGGKTISIAYNSPAMRGRKIMGGLVPYGKVWRTGANPATSFTTALDLKIGGLSVPAGSYTLYTLPAAPGTPWLLIVNKQTGQWGTVYDPAMDLGRSPMRSATLAAPQESMSISFEHATKHSVELHVKWETTDESVVLTEAMTTGTPLVP